jgi:two-component system, response regulator, stage 0 sporulation protein F
MTLNLPNDESPLEAPPFTSHSAILIVDEDPAFQLGLKTFLREYVGFEKIFLARNGQEAINLIRREPSIDLVSVDYRMPGMSGIELLRALRGFLDRPLAALMITGYPSDELEAEFRSLGTEHLLTSQFIAKPVQFEKLEHLILTAHDEVVAAQQRALETGEEENGEAGRESGANDFGLILTRLDLQSARLDKLEIELKKQRGKWRSDFRKVTLLLLVLWVGVKLGLLQKLEPHWSRMKEAISTSFSFEAPPARSRLSAPATDEPKTPVASD